MMLKRISCIALTFVVLASTYSIVQDQPCSSIIGCEICNDPASGKCDLCSADRNFNPQPDADQQCQCVSNKWLNSAKTMCAECQ